MKHPNLFAANYNRMSYLDNYFKLIITTENLDSIMNFYESNVPMNFRPSYDSYDALAEALDLYQADQSLITKVGSDILSFRLGHKIKNDAIFRKDPSYVKALEEALNKK